MQKKQNFVAISVISFMKKIFYLIALSLGMGITSCEKATETKPTKDENSIHLALGNPSNARIDESLVDNYLMNIPQYSMSYNSTKGHANWVSWIVDNSWVGTFDRLDDFRVNPELPENWYRVNQYDFFSPPNGTTPTGFDRGHLCPSADRTKTREDNSATFFMTNMIPQAPNNNQRTWGNLETETRTLTTPTASTITPMGAYVIAGTYGTGGDCLAGSFNSLQRGLINVPARTWKIIVLVPLVEVTNPEPNEVVINNPRNNKKYAPLASAKSGDNIARITNATRVIAVDMPNSQTIDSNWRLYRVSVDFLEQKTGYDFLSKIPQAIQDVLEARVDNL